MTLADVRVPERDRWKKSSVAREGVWVDNKNIAMTGSSDTLFVLKSRRLVLVDQNSRSLSESKCRSPTDWRSEAPGVYGQKQVLGTRPLD